MLILVAVAPPAALATEIQYSTTAPGIDLKFPVLTPSLIHDAALEYTQDSSLNRVVVGCDIYTITCYRGSAIARFRDIRENCFNRTSAVRNGVATCRLTGVAVPLLFKAAALKRYPGDPAIGCCQWVCRRKR